MLTFTEALRISRETPSCLVRVAIRDISVFQDELKSVLILFHELSPGIKTRSITTGYMNLPVAFGIKHLVYLATIF